MQFPPSRLANGMVEGRLPVKPLPSTTKDCMEVKLPIEAGMVPTRLELGNSLQQRRARVGWGEISTRHGGAAVRRGKEEGEGGVRTIESPTCRPRCR